ncbi:MAG: GntR family transcriptional regulator [Rhizobiaceae bacterium]|jgi:GntR family transcriptional repressor for pyruvate dehydrogenase complex|nr:GntR family transcriptional regulator [Rhizobiaceae bacterium]
MTVAPGHVSVFAPIQSARTADDIVWQVERLLLDGVLRPGQRLPGERELAAQLNVSRPVLREALETLEERQLVSSRRGDGTYVADLVGEVFAPPMMNLISSHPEAVREYLEYRHEVEGMAAEFAARRATGFDKQILESLMARMTDAFHNGEESEEWRVDVEFHTCVGECAHNLVLLHTLRSCYRLLTNDVFLNRAMITRQPGARDVLFKQHLAIGEAVLAGAPEMARDAAQAHIRYITEQMREAERREGHERVSRLRLIQRQDGAA